MIDARGDDADAIGFGPVQTDELRGLDRGGRDEPVRVRDHQLLARQTVRRLGTLAAR